MQVTVTYYEPCRDGNHEAYGLRGRYRTITGICRKVDAVETKAILVGNTRIPLGDVLKIEEIRFLLIKEQQQVACCTCSRQA